MTDHPLSTPPMRRKLATPPAQPASSCARCLREGTVAKDQNTHAGDAGISIRPLIWIRFECDHCGTTWTVPKDQALDHGRFLQRINQTPQRDV